MVVVDHHKTAFEQFSRDKAGRPNLEVNLEMQRSGATLALDYFRPQVCMYRCMLHTTAGPLYALDCIYSHDWMV